MSADPQGYLPPHKGAAVRMLWSTAIAAAGQMPLPERNANNSSYAPIAAYHRARRAIEASPPGLADWIAGQAIHEMARIVSHAHSEQLALFGRAEVTSCL